MKRSNECFKCRNRFCANGIISIIDKGESFNEIACSKHTDDLHDYANAVLGKNNGNLRLHVSTTGTLSRRMLKEKLKEVAE